MSLLVVGAGFAGAVYARTLAEAGWTVAVIDRRDHIAGNAFDEVTTNGTRIHRYGPHLFHTKNLPVAEWLRRFCEFIPYEHRSEVLLPEGGCVPMPVNRTTINQVFGLDLKDADAVKAFLATQAEAIAKPANAGEYLNASVGRTLTDLFFRPYVRKMWAFDLEELAISVVQRIPVRMDDEDRYFPSDAFQMLPRHGYTALIQSILDHPRIRVTLNCAFQHEMLRDAHHCFNSMAIDEFFGSVHGALPYRSIRFHHEDIPIAGGIGRTAVVNFSDNGPMTRQTDWQRLPGHTVHPGPLKTVTREEPCDYRDNDFERYYPVKVSDGRYDAIYRRYRAQAEMEDRLTFIGRCGTYQYLDMDQVINQSLSGARAWLRAAGEGPG